MKQSRRDFHPSSPKFIIPFGLFAFSLFAFFWWQGNLSPMEPSNTSQKTFIIDPGTPVRSIADQLHENKLIKDPMAFIIMVRLNGLANNLQAGTYQLSPSMNANEIAKSLTHGRDDIEVLVVEGKRATEIAAQLESVMPLYDPSWVQQLEANEGYLFPARYSFSRQATIQQVIDTMRSKFNAEYTKITNATKLSQEEIVILASLIEREAKHDEERSLISSVLHNRLAITMALQVDATVQYVVGYNQTEKTWWKKNLTLNDLNVTSPYNTYEQPGLPPAPIANPGLKSIQAAANPPQSEYLYYMTDKNGITHFGRTLADHNRNISTYGL